MVTAAQLEQSLSRFDAGERSQPPDDPADQGQRPRVFLCPGLAAQPWWPVPAEIAAAAADFLPAIQREARSLLLHNQDKTRHGSYVSGDDQDDGWLSTDFVQDGIWQPATCRHCPATVKFLQHLPLCDCSLARVYFSTLTARKHIRPHHGRTNIKLRMQLPLFMSPGPDSDATYCEMRVNGQLRQYAIGAPLLFDDSFLHEVHNHGPSDRMVLLCDLWHPQLLDFTQRILQSFPVAGSTATAASARAVNAGLVRWCTRCSSLFFGPECPLAHPSFRYILQPPAWVPLHVLPVAKAVPVPVVGSSVAGVHKTTRWDHQLRLRLQSVREEVARLRAELLLSE